MNVPQTNEPGFDDHLDLMSRDFSGIRLVALHGISGSGKSTALAQLLRAHPAFRGRPCSRVQGPRIAWRRLRLSERLVLVDECISLRDLLGLVELLRRGHQVLAASHLPLFTSALLGRVWPAVALRTDGSPAKIERYLGARGLRFGGEGVRDFCARFGASYNAVECILDFDGGSDFDRAYERFIRCCRVETERHPAPPSRSSRPQRSGRPAR